jgi:hypothetical protein
MATTAPPLSSPVGIAPLPPNPTPNRPSSAPSTAAASVPAPSPSEHVSEPAYEFLLSEIIQWVERDEKRIAVEARRVQQQQQKAGEENQEDGASTADEEAAAVMAAERSAARIERMGYDVGYRLCERLAQHRPLLGPGSPSPESGDGGVSLGDNNPLVMGGGGHHTVMDPKTQLEAVKFLCKGELFKILYVSSAISSLIHKQAADMITTCNRILDRSIQKTNRQTANKSSRCIRLERLGVKMVATSPSG